MLRSSGGVTYTATIRGPEMMNRTDISFRCKEQVEIDAVERFSLEPVCWLQRKGPSDVVRPFAVTNRVATR